MSLEPSEDQADQGGHIFIHSFIHGEFPSYRSRESTRDMVEQQREWT